MVDTLMNENGFQLSHLHLKDLLGINGTVSYQLSLVGSGGVG